MLAAFDAVKHTALAAANRVFFRPSCQKCIKQEPIFAQFVCQSFILKDMLSFAI
jgi:hypothetical protein